MARTALTPVSAPNPYDVAAAAIALAAGDAVNFNEVVATGKEFIIAQNTDGAAAHTLTVHSVADAYGRTGDLVESIPASGFIITQQFPVAGWQQSDGKLYIDVDNALIELVVVRLP